MEREISIPPSGIENPLDQTEIDQFLSTEQDGYLTETEMHLFVLRFLITKDQAMRLIDRGLDIWCITNGKFSLEDFPLVQDIVNDWNAKLGKQVFKW